MSEGEDGRKGWRPKAFERIHTVMGRVGGEEAVRVQSRDGSGWLGLRCQWRSWEAVDGSKTYLFLSSFAFRSLPWTEVPRSEWGKGPDGSAEAEWKTGMVVELCKGAH